MARPIRLGWLVVCLVCPPLAAQERADIDSTDALVLDHDFAAGVGEIVRVFLQAKQVYRAELSSTDVTVGIRTLTRGLRQPRIYPITDALTPSGTSLVEIYPEADAEYELRPVDARGGGVSTRLRLYRDIRASRRRVAIIDKAGWEIGIEVAGGWHGGYVQAADSRGPDGSLVPDEGDAGSDFEACFAARNAPGFDRFSLCALGLGWGSQHGTRSTLWFFTEPRFRVLGRYERGQSNWEGGLLFRVAAGSIERTSEVPVMLAPGLYLARHIRTRADGAGWSFHVSYSYATIRNTVKRTDGSSPTTSRVMLGLGVYR